MACLKNIVKMLSPPILVDFITLIRRLLRGAKNRDLIRINRDLAGTCIRRRAVFLGNGPSLTCTDLNSLEGVDIFVCNDFFLHPDAHTINVTGYLNFDPSEAWIEKAEAFCAAGAKPDYFVLPVGMADRVARSAVLRCQTVYYICHFGLSSLDKFYRRPDRPLFLIQNVVIGFMVWADFLGYAEGGLLGADFSFLTSRDKRRTPHFYAAGKHSTANVTDADVRVYSRMCLNMHRVQERIRLVKDWSSTKYFNLTEESFLEYLPFENIYNFIKNR